MARTDTLGHFLTDVADAIREKTGEANTIQASSFDTKILSISGGGASVEDMMRIIDFVDHEEIMNEADYSEENISRAEELIDFYYNMEVNANG